MSYKKKPLCIKFIGKKVFTSNCGKVWKECESKKEFNDFYRKVMENWKEAHKAGEVNILDN